MCNQAQQILQQLNKALETDQIKLPTLPEVAIKIRQAVEKDEHSAVEIANLLEQDTSLSARLLQLANSPLYRARTQIDNLQMAVTRLGVRIVKELVVMLAIKQTFETNNKQLAQYFKNTWQTSMDVATACRVLAKQHNKLDSEQAVLAGLIHNIGALPIIELAAHQPELVEDPQNFIEICNEIQGPLGEKILKFWNFPQSLIEVVCDCNQFDRQNSNEADYVDIVQAAILHTRTHNEADTLDWSNISAIHKLGLDPDVHHFDEATQVQLEQTRSSLFGL